MSQIRRPFQLSTPPPIGHAGAAVSCWPIMTGEMTRAISPLHASQTEPQKWLTDSIADQPPISPYVLQEGKWTSVWCICGLGMMYFHTVKRASQWRGKPLWLADKLLKRCLLFCMTLQHIWTLRWFSHAHCSQVITIQCGRHVCMHWPKHDSSWLHDESGLSMHPCACMFIHLHILYTCIQIYRMYFTSTLYSWGIDYLRGNSFIHFCRESKQ